MERFSYFKLKLARMQFRRNPYGAEAAEKLISATVLRADYRARNAFWLMAGALAATKDPDRAVQIAERGALLESVKVFWHAKNLVEKKLDGDEQSPAFGAVIRARALYKARQDEIYAQSVASPGVAYEYDREGRGRAVRKEGRSFEAAQIYYEAAESLAKNPNFAADKNMLDEAFRLLSGAQEEVSGHFTALTASTRAGTKQALADLSATMALWGDIDVLKADVMQAQSKRPNNISRETWMEAIAQWQKDAQYRFACAASLASDNEARSLRQKADECENRSRNAYLVIA